MEKIILIDYIGNSTADGNPTGHCVKVAKEYGELIEDAFSVEIAAPKNLKKFLDNFKYGMPYYAIRGEGGLKNTIRNYFVEWLNIRNIWKNAKRENVWFYNTDYLVYLWLILHRKLTHKVICSTYVSIPQEQHAVIKFIKYSLLKLASSKIDLIIYSNNEFKCDYMDTVYMPDYLYDPEQYEKYRKPKKEKAVCLGTISKENKEILELIQCFNKNGYPLEIVGKFYEDDYYKQALEIKNDNIVIKNEFIDTDEYYSLLAEAKYSVLPYRISVYKHKTSGVILESIFLDAIPVAPEEILRKNGIPGIGYSSIDELSDFAFVTKNQVISEIHEQVDEKYSITRNKKRIVDAICSISK